MARRKADPKRVNRAVAGELRGFVERYEQITAEMAELGDGRKAVMAEAKARGYDTKVMRLIIKERTRDPADMAEEAAIAAVYREALGMEGTPLGDWAADGEPDEEPEPETVFAPAPRRGRGRPRKVVDFGQPTDA